MLYKTMFQPRYGKPHKKQRRHFAAADQHSDIKSLIQTKKLRVSAPGDRHEQEADRVAEHVVSNSPININSVTQVDEKNGVQRMCEECEDELQRKAVDHSSTTDTSTAGVNSLSNGQPLSPTYRHFFENKMGTDFSSVRIHTNVSAQHSAQAINARAYTTGNHIAFNSGQFQPASIEGKKLLAHELTHVIQQRQGINPGIQRSCFDGNCEDCADGWKTLWITVFFARRANADTMATLRRRINVAKRILEQCCIRLKFAFNWTLIANAATVSTSSSRPAGDASGIRDVPERNEAIGESDLISSARGIPMLVVDEVTGTGGGTTILGVQDDQSRDFDLEYTGPSMFFMAVNQPREGACSQRDSTIAHELWHITGALRHDAAEAGGIADCSSDDVNETYCNAVRGLT